MMVKMILVQKSLISGGNNSIQIIVKTSIINLELMIKGRAVKCAPFLDGDIAKHC